MSEGETPWASTGAPFSVKETDVLGFTDGLLPSEFPILTVSDCVLATVASQNSRKRVVALAQLAHAVQQCSAAVQCSSAVQY